VPPAVWCHRTEQRRGRGGGGIGVPRVKRRGERTDQRQTRVCHRPCCCRFGYTRGCCCGRPSLPVWSHPRHKKLDPSRTRDAPGQPQQPCSSNGTRQETPSNACRDGSNRNGYPCGGCEHGNRQAGPSPQGR
ncbi:unnamed protein product, partial [Laminaria digitata]